MSNWLPVKYMQDKSKISSSLTNDVFKSIEPFLLIEQHCIYLCFVSHENNLCNHLHIVLTENVLEIFPRDIFWISELNSVKIELAHAKRSVLSNLAWRDIYQWIFTCWEENFRGICKILSSSKTFTCHRQTPYSPFRQPLHWVHL